MYELVSIHERSRWQKVLDLLRISDIYYSNQYFMAATKLDPGEPLLFYYKDHEGEIAYPFIKRRIASEENEYFDITTPFGYGGPLTKGKKNNPLLIANFRKAFTEYCHEEKIIAEYIRFHPIMENAHLLKNYVKLIPLYETFSMDIHPRKKEGKKELVSGKDMETDGISKLVIKKLGTVRHMFEFLVLYYLTIRRREEADSYYFFTDDYFETLISSLGPNLHLFGAFQKNKMISACYVLTSKDRIYHHLESSLEDSDTEAMKLLLLKIAEWGEENHFKSFHLGGDFKGERQQESRLKQDLSNSKPHTFYIGHHIYDEETYNRLMPPEEQDIIKRYRNI